MHAGIGAEDVVALFMKNSPAFLEIAFAASYLGAIFLPVNYRLAAAEADYILKDAGARLLFVDQEFAAVQALDISKIVIDEAAAADSRALSPALTVPPCHVTRESDLVRLMYIRHDLTAQGGHAHL